jgi:hypothetical protein
MERGKRSSTGGRWPRSAAPASLRPHETTSSVRLSLGNFATFQLRSHEVGSMRTITAAVVAGSLAIASPQGRSAEPLVHDAAYGFSVAVPAFAKEIESGISITPIAFGGPVHEGKAASCNVQIQNTGATLSDFRTQSLVQAKALGITLESETRRKVSGKDALLFVSSGGELRVLSLAVQVGSSIYLVTCLAATDQFPRYEKTFRSVIDSFSLD